MFTQAEKENDRDVVYAVNASAFETPVEDNEKAVGTIKYHVAFSNV